MAAARTLRIFFSPPQALRSALSSPRRNLSTTRLLRTAAPGSTGGGATPTPTTNPSLPAFSLRRISPNPRVRWAVGVGLALLAVGEGYAWVKFWPRVTGKGEGAGQE